MRFLLSLLCFGILVSCVAEKAPVLPVKISHVVVTEEKIEPGKPLPTFTDHFEAGKKIIYAYVFFENIATMTGSLPVRLQWFSPNDFSPPIGMSTVTLEPPATTAEFALNDSSGLKKGPYQALVFAGNPVTATGSVRFFVGMTREEAGEFMRFDEEAREMYRKKIEAEIEREKSEELPPALTGGEE